MPTSRRSRIDWDIYEEHIDEAGFLCDQWELALKAANYSLEEVIAGPEERLLAHLDALILGGKVVAHELLVPKVRSADPGTITAAAWVLLQSEDEEFIHTIVDRLLFAADDKRRAALGRALRLCTRRDLPDRLMPILKTCPPPVQAVMVEALAGRESANERFALPLSRLLSSKVPELVAATLHAVRCMPDPAFTEGVVSALDSNNAAVRDAAIEAGVAIGAPAAWAVCRRAIAAGSNPCRLPLAILAIGGDSSDLDTVIALVASPEHRAQALWALGFSGRVAATEAALSFISDKKMAKVAADSFALISGLPLSGKMVIPVREDVDDDRASIDDDALPILRAEDDLPHPNPDAIERWWKRNKSRFEPTKRYVAGELASREVLQKVLLTGSMWRQPVRYLELGARARFAVNPTSWCRAQRDAVHSMPDLPATDMPFALRGTR